MKKLYICFGGACYDNSVARIVTAAPQLGADKVYVYDDQWLMEQEFYQINKWLWDPHPINRGFGWWCWKPFIIMDALEHFAEVGDVVLYTDADTYPVQDFSVLYRVADKEGLMLFEGSHWWQKEWCKRDCYIAMGMDERKGWECKHAVGRFMLFKKGPYLVKQLLMEWQAYLLNPLCNTREPSRYGPELQDFREHREDQSILSLLAVKYGIRLYREADQGGKQYTHDRDLYPVLFHQRDEWNGKKPSSSAGCTAPAMGSRWRNV